MVDPSTDFWSSLSSQLPRLQYSAQHILAALFSPKSSLCFWLSKKPWALFGPPLLCYHQAALSCKLVPLQISPYLFSFTQALQPRFAVVQFPKAIVSYNFLVSYLFKAKGKFTLHSNNLVETKVSISLLFKNTFTI